MKQKHFTAPIFTFKFIWIPSKLPNFTSFADFWKVLRSLKLSLRIIQLPNPLRHTATLVDTITICLFKLECTIVLFQTVMCMHCVYYRTLPPGSPHRTRLCFYMYMCVCCLAFLAFSSPLIRTMYVCVYFWAVPQLHGREWWPLVTLCVCVFFRSLREIKCHRLMKSTEIFIFPLFSFFFFSFFSSFLRLRSTPEIK